MRPTDTRSKPRSSSPAVAGRLLKTGRSRVVCAKSSCAAVRPIVTGKSWSSRGLEKISEVLHPKEKGVNMPSRSASPHLPFGDDKNAPWYGKDILSVKQFSRDDLEYVFGVAH